MAHRSFASDMRRVVRAAARAQRAREQAAARAHSAARRAEREKDIETRHQQREREADARLGARQAREAEKEVARQYVAARIEEAAEITHEAEKREQEIEGLLQDALSRDPRLDLSRDRQSFQYGHFDETKWSVTEPDQKDFMPARQGAFARMLPGAAARAEQQAAEADRLLAAAREAFAADRHNRDLAYSRHLVDEASRRTSIEEHNGKVDDFEKRLTRGEHDEVVRYFQRVLDESLRGEPDAESAIVGFSVDSAHLIVDIELPEISVIPEETAFRYVKATDCIEASLRPAIKRKALYARLVNLVCLKCVDTVFRSDPGDLVACLTLNGMLDAVDPATGQDVRVCLLSVRVTVDTFRTLKLVQVEPEQCLRSLKASVSKAPTELLAVKPLVELDMVDPRFIASLDVLSTLDSRPNLMELTPGEFEALITNLFGTMGLDTKQTQASRDGGVDCVAFDSRPVFGGKVVIQAKRYRNTVGVSAVRDLFGTVQNEGASKGILVTTSGYGKAAYDFANGKPLELLDGGNLLFLLAEHAKVEARIVMPDDWRDVVSHEEKA